MPTVVSCECGQRFQAADWLAGREVPCPSCGQTILVPGQAAEATEPAAEAPAAAPAEKIVVACKCGKRFQAGAKLLGKVVKCPGCGNPLKVQRAAANSGPAKTTAPKTAAAKSTPARPAPAPAKSARSADTNPLAMDLSTFDSTTFDQGGLGEGFDQGGLGAADLGQGGFGTEGLDQAGFDQGGLGQGDLGQGGLDSPLDSMSMGYGQPQTMGGDAGAHGQPGGQPNQEAAGGRSFELSPQMLVILFSIGGGAIALMLLAIFVPPLYHYLMTPAEVAVAPTPVASVPAAPDAGPLNWMPYVSPTGGYSVDFPGTPVTTPTTPNSLGGIPSGDSPASIHMPTRGEFSVVRMPLPQMIEMPELRRLFVKNSMDTFANSGILMITLRNDISVGESPGIEARIEGKNQSRDFEGQCRLVLTKSHLYFVVYAVPKGQFNNEDASRFLGSFKIVSPN